MSSEPPAQDAGTAAPGASAAAGNVAFIVSGTKPDPHRPDPQCTGNQFEGTVGSCGELAMRLIRPHRDADFLIFDLWVVAIWLPVAEPVLRKSVMDELQP
jgi:hypothetical protein